MTEHKKRDVELKYCSYCKEWKNKTEFHKNKFEKDGLCHWCKFCRSIAEKEYNKKYREIHREQIRAYHKSAPVRKKHNERGKKHRKVYGEKHREYYRVYYENYQKDNPQYKLSRSMKSAIYKTLKNNKNSTHWEKLVNYTLQDLRKHLEKQFTTDMTWDNYGDWHVDHKIPISAFNFNTYNDIDFQKCFALENLQPMWAEDNIRKGGKLKRDFQPSLTLAILKGSG